MKLVAFESLDDASPREGCCSPKTRAEGRCPSTAGGESNHSDHLTQLVKHSDSLHRTSRVIYFINMTYI